VNSIAVLPLQNLNGDSSVDYLRFRWRTKSPIRSLLLARSTFVLQPSPEKTWEPISTPSKQAGTFM